MEFVADRDELCEPDLPGHEAHRAAVTAEENCQVRVRHEAVKFTQLLINVVNSQRLAFDRCNATLILITAKLLRQQFREFHAPIVG